MWYSSDLPFVASSRMQSSRIHRCHPLPLQSINAQLSAIIFPFSCHSPEERIRTEEGDGGARPCENTPWSQVLFRKSVLNCRRDETHASSEQCRFGSRRDGVFWVISLLLGGRHSSASRCNQLGVVAGESMRDVVSDRVWVWPAARCLGALGGEDWLSR